MKHESQPKGNDARLGIPPVRGWRIAFLVIATVSICLSADLLRLHINVHTDPEYQSYCAMSERVNCETVALSDFALFGGLPLATWGILAYAAMAAMAIWGLRSRLRTPTWPFGILFWLSGFASVVGGALFVISHFVIESVCLVCAVTYCTNFFMLGSAAMALRRCGVGPIGALAADVRALVRAPRAVAVFAVCTLTIAAVTWLATPAYWRLGADRDTQENIATGITAEGLPWIGAREPVVEIVEFSDYQCPYCQRGHDEMRQLLAREPTRVRLIHRHYPLDHHCNTTLKKPFHPEACRYAKLAHCAQQQNKFWRANDYLFAHGRRKDPITTEEFANAVGLSTAVLEACVRAPHTRDAVQHDLATGRRLKIRGTPTFVIGEQTYPGRIPPEIIERSLAGQRAGGPAPADPDPTRVH